MDAKRFDILAIVILLLAVVSVYANSLPNDFIFDDQHVIINNSYIKSPQYIPLFFKGFITSVPIVKGMYRPLLMLTFSFNYFFSQLKPHGYHIINMLIHFLNACFLYYLLWLLAHRLKYIYRLLIALLFCIHPVNTEAVTYISSRSDLLYSFFILASISLFIMWRLHKGRMFYAGSLALYILALLTKESALVLIGLLCAYECAMSKNFLQELRRIIIRLFPFLLVTGGYFILRNILFGVALESAPTGVIARSLFLNILTQSAISFFYLYLFVFPINLCANHDYPVLTPSNNPLSLFFCALIIGIILICFISKKKIHPLVIFSVFWYFISLSPKFYAKLNYMCMEHHAYLAYFALYFIMAHFLSEHKGKIRFAKEFVIFIFLLFFLLTVLRNFEWRNHYLLWKATLRVNPSSGLAHGSLGNYLVRNGRYEEAEGHLLKAMHSPITILRSNVILNLITVYALKGELDKGWHVFTEQKGYLFKTHAAGLPGFYKAVGLLYLKAGDFDRARKVWGKGIKRYPGNAPLKTITGWSYLQDSHDKENAGKYFQDALMVNPDSALAHFGLGIVLEETDVNRAIMHFQKALLLAPKMWDAYFRIGLLYAQKLLDPRAEYYFKKTIELNPKYAPAYYNLGVFYLSLPEPDYGSASFYIEQARSLGYPVDQKIDAMLRER